MLSHKFNIGDIVALKPAIKQNILGGIYQVTKQLPEKYCIKKCEGTLCARGLRAGSKYPPAEPVTLGWEPLEAAGPCCINPHSYSHCAMPPQEPSVLLGHPYLTFW